ncbi:MAG TPA: SHOCT domain-containing protein [Gaiellaceae bacterium]|nr:SHOCT domain-containing protein [Gaiellaceae bacterium]
MGLGGVIGILATGFLLGAAARWIVPGPDPMPLWLTIAIGMIASLAGGGIAAGIFGSNHITTSRGHVFVTLLLEVGVATGVVVAYRRFVQRRAVIGPEAHRFPTRGVGIERMRARLRQVGIDPEQLTGRPDLRALRHTERPAEEPPAPNDELATLRELHERGILTDEEFDAARRRIHSE